MRRTLLIATLLIGIVAYSPTRAEYPDCDNLPYDAWSGICVHTNCECPALNCTHRHEIENGGDLGVITGD